MVCIVSLLIWTIYHFAPYLVYILFPALFGILYQVPPSLLNEDMLKIPHGIEESVMEGIKGIKKMYEHDEMRPRIGNKIAKMVFDFILVGRRLIMVFN